MLFKTNSAPNHTCVRGLVRTSTCASSSVNPGEWESTFRRCAFSTVNLQFLPPNGFLLFRRSATDADRPLCTWMCCRQLPVRVSVCVRINASLAQSVLPSPPPSPPLARARLFWGGEGSLIIFSLACWLYPSLHFSSSSTPSVVVSLTS